MTTRRSFLASAATAPLAAQSSQAPWYRRTYRWGQTNITEIDPTRYDIPWWRAYWKRTRVQGVVINAGGIVAYYPSKFPLHHRAEFLNGRDLYGELAKAAHEDGLAVFARMDSNRTSEDFFKAHPDWFCRDAKGEPYRAADKYITCINSPYYDDYLPAVLTEIIERSKPEGFTDNSWSGMGREAICYCNNCQWMFKAKAAMTLPAKADWDDAAYRKWIMWNYERRLEVWDLNNRVTKKAGGEHCIWIGMNSGSIASQARSFRDMKEICARAPMIMLDHQRREDATGFQQNGETGKLVHGLLGWDKIVPESMALYQAARNWFRVSAKPAAEARMWMVNGFAGGIQPWWHHIGAYHEDRRAYKTAEPIMRWYETNQAYLVDRTPVAAIGVVWSQRNTDFYGRDRADELTEAPYRGVIQALVRARIPYIPVNADHVTRDGPSLSALVLPNTAALSDSQCAAIRGFVERGGGLLATGAATLHNEWGDPRPDFALADLFGAHAEPGFAAAYQAQAAATQHSYLRLHPEWRGRIDGPKIAGEPASTAPRHPALKGFDDTDILPFGGLLARIRIDAAAAVPLTFVPPFPAYPPETAWSRTPVTDIPGLVVNKRVAYLPADIDRRFNRENLPDHGDLLANLIRWAAGDGIPLAIEGPGLLDCHLYQQPGRLILHIVNLTSAGTWRQPIDELIPIGPFRVRVKLPKSVKSGRVKLLVSEAKTAAKTQGGWVEFEVRSIADHEVAVIA